MPEAIVAFVSHSSADSDLARAVAELLQRSFRLSSRSIRCTSVDAYRLPAGADTDRQLRSEIMSAEVFIGIVTPSSVRSEYVLFELGARWGADKHLVPAFGCGLRPQALPGPIARQNALDLTNTAQVFHLLDNVAEVLDRLAEPSASLQDSVAAVVTAASVASEPQPGRGDEAEPPARAELTADEIRVLQMFVEFRDKHNTDDVMDRLKVSRHKAEYFLHRLEKMHLISHLSEYRNGSHVFFIVDDGRGFLVERGLL